MIEPYGSEPELVVLHTLRCGGFTSLDRLTAVAADVAPDDVEGLLLDLAAQGLVRRSDGPFGGWGVTDAGRAADAQRIAQELERAGARPEIQAAYEEFLPLNPRTLDICGAWQVRSWGPPMVLNDHSDGGYDAQVLKQLAAVNAAAQPICARLAARLARFSHYGPRLQVALDRARQGEHDKVADGLDSFHNVWFQLHEDLLVTLGLSRGE